MQLGNWQLDTINGGLFRLDGGVMFGVVPRTIWKNVAPPDETNRIQCANNCVLARDGTHTVLIDTGYGGKFAPLDRRFYSMEEGRRCLEGLAALGVAPEEIDTVVLSHLHFDHVCGATRFDAAGKRVPIFHRARHIVGRLEWEDATGRLPELESAYPLEDILPLVRGGADDGHRRRPTDRARAAGRGDRRAHARAHGAVLRVGGADSGLPG